MIKTIKVKYKFKKGDTAYRVVDVTDPITDPIRDVKIIGIESTYIDGDDGKTSIYYNTNRCNSVPENELYKTRKKALENIKSGRVKALESLVYFQNRQIESSKRNIKHCEKQLKHINNWVKNDNSKDRRIR